MAKKKQVLKEGQKTPDYDSAWKEVIEKHFEPFLEFSTSTGNRAVK